MRLYDEILEKKRTGESILLDELSPEKLRILYIEEEMTDGMIAELFDVKPSKITYIRRKNGITIRNSIIEDFIKNIPQEIEDNFKKDIFTEANITKIAKAITHFAFRNGPIEGMHADTDKHITDQDMKILNKFMVNRLAYIFSLIKDDRWFEFNFLIDSNDRMFGHGWDNADPDDGGMRELLINELDMYRN